jgi:hypothetical protein
LVAVSFSALSAAAMAAFSAARSPAPAARCCAAAGAATSESGGGAARVTAGAASAAGLAGAAAGTGGGAAKRSTGSASSASSAPPFHLQPQRRQQRLSFHAAISAPRGVPRNGVRRYMRGCWRTPEEQGMSDAEQRESMEFDVLVVGGGPAGLAAAIRLKQISPDINVCVVEKGGEVGAHILSGAVVEPRALDELLPDWRDDPPAMTTAVTEDRFVLLTATRAVRLPTPPQMHNAGNYVVSLGNVCRWLAQKAEALGVEIYAGFAASETIIEDGQVKGVVAGVMGITREASAARTTSRAWSCVPPTRCSPRAAAAA